jgi:hypothetical protein
VTKIHPSPALATATKPRGSPPFATALLVAMAVLSCPVVAQSGKGPTAAEMAEACARSPRLSESTATDRTRKPLGRPTEQNCREFADAWVPRLLAWQKEGNSSAMLRAVPAICKDLAERVAGRPVEVAWCSNWGIGRGSTFDPPDEIWTALDTSHATGGADRSALERAVKEMIERRLVANWDQVQVRDHLRSMEFGCEIKPDLTTTICSVNIQEHFGWQPQSQTMFVVITRVDVMVRFEAGHSPGARHIEVTSTRAAL